MGPYKTGRGRAADHGGIALPIFTFPHVSAGLSQSLRAVQARLSCQTPTDPGHVGPAPESRRFQGLRTSTEWVGSAKRRHPSQGPPADQDSALLWYRCGTASGISSSRPDVDIRKNLGSAWVFRVVAGAGFEPATFGL